MRVVQSLDLRAIGLIGLKVSQPATISVRVARLHTGRRDEGSGLNCCGGCGSRGGASVEQGCERGGFREGEGGSEGNDGMREDVFRRRTSACTELSGDSQMQPA